MSVMSRAAPKTKHRIHTMAAEAAPRTSYDIIYYVHKYK